MIAKKIIQIAYIDYFADDADDLDAENEEKWTEAFRSVMSGGASVAWWECSGLLYALHRSTKQDGFLQLSISEIRGGDLIPCGDSQYINIDAFILDMAAHCGINVNVA